MAASDPANVYSLPLESVERDPLSRPRGIGALLVTRGGRVAIAVEARGKRYTVADWLSADFGDLQEKLEAQRGRPTRIRVPAWENVAVVFCAAVVPLAQLPLPVDAGSWNFSSVVASVYTCPASTLPVAGAAAAVDWQLVRPPVNP